MPQEIEVARLGCTLHGECRGEGDPVLFIQGVGVCGSGWKPQVDALSKQYSCLTFDNRGIGRSQPAGDAAITVDEMSADALAAMDAQGWESAHVVGHSLGGLIALRMALDAKPRVRSLSLLCTFADGNEATKLTWALLWIGMRTRIGSAGARRRAFLELLLTPEAHARADHESLAAELAPLFGHDLGVQPPIAMKQLAAMRGYDLRPRLHELAGVRTLVVSAKHDLIARPSAGRQIAEGIAGAEYVEVEDAAHGLPLTHVDPVNSLLQRNLAGDPPCTR